jgi:hypothetical protein
MNITQACSEINPEFSPLLDPYIVEMLGEDKAAETLIYKGSRDGKTVYFIDEVDQMGLITGKTIEGSKSELVSFLIKNKYV